MGQNTATCMYSYSARLNAPDVAWESGMACVMGC